VQGGGCAASACWRHRRRRRQRPPPRLPATTARPPPCPPLQAAKQAAAQLEAQLAAAREAARLELAAEQRRQAAAVEALRKELQGAKQERNRAEYERDVLRDQLEAGPAAQQAQRPGARLGQAALGMMGRRPAALPGPQQGQPAPWAAAGEQQQWEEEAHARGLPHSSDTAGLLQGGAAEGAAEAEAAAAADDEQLDEAGALELLDDGGEDVPALSPGISRPGHISSRPLAAPRFAGKSGVPDSFMGVGSFSRGGIIRQGPDGRGGQTKALAPISNTAKRVPSAFVSSSGTAKKSKHAKLGAAAGTASIQSFFGRAAG
jgi:hypothetical protein